MKALTILFLWLLTMAATGSTIYNGSSTAGCIRSEGQALLRFKQDIVDESNRLGSWGGDGDCCNWTGVVCDLETGHVSELHLRTTYADHEGSTLAENIAYNDMSKLRGKINNSLLDLKRLTYLDLSGNDFEGSEIPKFLGSIKSLRYLNLADAQFAGMLPTEIGNLTELRYLIIGDENGRVHSNSLKWLYGLSSLELLDLSGVNLTNALDWLQGISRLPSLVKLSLSFCQLQYIPPLSFANFSSFAVLDLSLNDFSLIPQWVFSLTNLISLNLSGNDFQGPVPIGLRNMTFLRHLDLSKNYFNSSIPDWVYGFSGLEFLSLAHNSLEGKISTAIRNLSHTITQLNIGQNRFQVEWDDGTLIRSIGHLCNLRSISLSSIEMNQDIGYVIQNLSTCVSGKLESLDLSYCQLSGHLTNHISQFKNLAFLYLQANSISGTIPVSLGGISSLTIVDLSFNSMDGVVSEVHFANLTGLVDFRANGNPLKLNVSPTWQPPFHRIAILGLGSWQMGPKFPLWLQSLNNLYLLNISNSGLADAIPWWFWSFSPNLMYLNLSNNQIHGEIPDIDEALPKIHFLDLSSNNFRGRLPRVSSGVLLLHLSNNLLSGSISHFLCFQSNQSNRMEVVNLERNQLSGEIPNCWNRWKSLGAIMLNDNRFNGSIPKSMGVLNSIKSLHLQGNNISGRIPLSLASCTELLMLDFSENQLDGKIPAWIGKRLSQLKFLNLRSNKFHGRIPQELCYLTALKVLDLAQNQLSGSIPQCINNYSAMTLQVDSLSFWDDSYFLDVMPIMNGKALEDIMPMALANEIVISGMKLMNKGRVYDYSTGILQMARTMDLSSNNLSGEIPMELTSLIQLQSLNLSSNSLTGKIPQDIGAMSVLETLDLSQNQLSGKIPQGITTLTFLNHLNLSHNKLIGRIPSSTQIDGFDASCFTGNQLCGPPLKDDCDHSSPGQEHPIGDDSDSDGGERVHMLYWTTVLYGFVVGFWSVVGPLAFSRKWRLAYFQFLDRLWYRTCLYIRNIA